MEQELEQELGGSSIRVDDLLVGEANAMELVGSTFASLYVLKPKYLRSLIARFESDESGKTQVSLPLFKLVLFFAEHMQEHMKKDVKLMKAIEQQQQQSEMRRMFGH